MLTVDRVYRSFGQNEVLKDVSFKIADQSLVGLIGPSGAGKSVLLKILGGVQKQDAGCVNNCATGGPMEVSLMFQEGALFDSLSVFGNVAFPLVHGRVPSDILPRKLREEVHEKVNNILARVGLSKAASKMPGQLSGGMRRRLSLARALVTRPKLVLLDDPTSGLDPVASSVIMDFIAELHREYKPTALLVSHDLRRLLPIVDHILVLDEGRMKFYGDLEGLKNCRNESIRHFVSCRYELGPVAQPV